MTSASTNKAEGYIGRFAPSPTGALHFGSLVAAVGSYLQARGQGGRWLLRMEDLDPPREVAGASDAILRSLEAHGLGWDGEVLYQSRRHEAYREHLEVLLSEGLAYRCDCSRKQQPGIYDGRCRRRHIGPEQRHAVRLMVEGQVSFDDLLQGPMSYSLEQLGDFVLRRADGLYAYQLAVVVDDAAQGVTEVVRGCDLLDSSPRQIYLQRQLDLPQPDYLHLPVAVNELGQKLSKQSHALALDDRQPLPSLIQALSFLGQRPPVELAEASMDEFWRWAIEHWDIHAIGAGHSRPAPLAQSHTAK